MKIWLRLVYADGDVAATLLRHWRWSYDFVALLYPIYIESEIPIRFYYMYDQGASTALLLRYCALAVSATLRVILTKISNRSGIAVQWNGGAKPVPNLYSHEYKPSCLSIYTFTAVCDLTLKASRKNASENFVC